MKQSLFCKKNNLRLPNLKKQFIKIQEIITPETAVTSTQKSKKNMETLRNYECVSKLKEVNSDQNYLDFFQIKEKLGEGAHAIVYRCIEKSTGNQRAIKLSKRRDEELINGMRECYHIMKELDHPQILKGHFLFINESKITCQMVSDISYFPQLAEFMQEQRKRKELVSEATVADIMSSILNVLVYLKKKGVCHRDLKPDNILYEPKTGQIKIIDFEIARMQRYENQKLDLWSNTGVIHYRAPESFRGGYSEEIDVWAVGVIAYELLVGKLPFMGQTDKEIMVKIRQSNLDFDSLNISSCAKSFLSKLLMKDPKKRITPRQALSCPFILKNLPMDTLTSSDSQLNSSFESYGERQFDEGDEVHEHKFYDEDSHCRLSQILGEDIGVRLSTN